MPSQDHDIISLGKIAMKTLISNQNEGDILPCVDFARKSAESKKSSTAIRNLQTQMLELLSRKLYDLGGSEHEFDKNIHNCQELTIIAKQSLEIVLEFLPLPELIVKGKNSRHHLVRIMSILPQPPQVYLPLLHVPTCSETVGEVILEVICNKVEEEPSFAAHSLYFLNTLLEEVTVSATATATPSVKHITSFLHHACSNSPKFMAVLANGNILKLSNSKNIESRKLALEILCCCLEAGMCMNNSEKGVEDLDTRSIIGIIIHVAQHDKDIALRCAAVDALRECHLSEAATPTLVGSLVWSLINDESKAVKSKVLSCLRPVLKESASVPHHLVEIISKQCCNVLKTSGTSMRMLMLAKEVLVLPIIPVNASKMLQCFRDCEGSTAARDVVKTIVLESLNDDKKSYQEISQSYSGGFDFFLDLCCCKDSLKPSLKSLLEFLNFSEISTLMNKVLEKLQFFSSTEEVREETDKFAFTKEKFRIFQAISYLAAFTKLSETLKSWFEWLKMELSLVISNEDHSNVLAKPLLELFRVLVTSNVLSFEQCKEIEILVFPHSLLRHGLVSSAVGLALVLPKSGELLLKSLAYLQDSAFGRHCVDMSRACDYVRLVGVLAKEQARLLEEQLRLEFNSITAKRFECVEKDDDLGAMKNRTEEEFLLQVSKALECSVGKDGLLSCYLPFLLTLTDGEGKNKYNSNDTIFSLRAAAVLSLGEFIKLSSELRKNQLLGIIKMAGDVQEPDIVRCAAIQVWSACFAKDEQGQDLYNLMDEKSPKIVRHRAIASVLALLRTSRLKGVQIYKLARYAADTDIVMKSNVLQYLKQLFIDQPSAFRIAILEMYFAPIDEIEKDETEKRLRAVMACLSVLEDKSGGARKQNISLFTEAVLARMIKSSDQQSGEHVGKLLSLLQPTAKTIETIEASLPTLRQFQSKSALRFLRKHLVSCTKGLKKANGQVLYELAQALAALLLDNNDQSNESCLNDENLSSSDDKTYCDKSNEHNLNLEMTSSTVMQLRPCQKRGVQITNSEKNQIYESNMKLKNSSSHRKRTSRYVMNSDDSDSC